jgi:adenylate kinase
MKPVYIIIGIPGSGKNTQGKLLAEKLNIPHIDAGDTFTEIIRTRSTVYWEEIAATYKLGPISTELFMKIMGEKFESEPLKNGFILTQNTKSPDEIIVMFNKLKSLDFDIQQIFCLNISRDTAIERAIKRLDGKFTEKEPNIESLIARVDKYCELFDSIKEYYKGHQMLVEIDGEQAEPVVFEKILEHLTIE